MKVFFRYASSSDGSDWVELKSVNTISDLVSWQLSLGSVSRPYKAEWPTLLLDVSDDGECRITIYDDWIE